MSLLRPLAFTAALGIAAICGTNALTADDPKPVAPAPTAKPDAPMSPVKVTDVKVETKTAVTPKPLSAAVKSGIAYLIKNQQEDGGWNQGGGWRTGVEAKGGRVEGKNVEDPSDMGNTCFALLALIRAGHTPIEGEYKENVKKGMIFVLGRIEKSDADSLLVTDVKGTQLQSKIGPYVDTFLANLVLAELKGKSGSDEKRLIAALEKTMNKIVKHQTAEGGFANNSGWAPTLSLALCNKGISRAKQNGVQVDDKVLARAFDQSKMAASGTTAPAIGGPAAGKPDIAGKPGVEPGFAGRSGAGGGLGSGDAGVRLYSLSQGAGNSQDVVNGLKLDYEKAKETLKDAKATPEQRDRATKQVEWFAKADGENKKAQDELAKNVRSETFVAGFGSNGGEEFLSFLNISEALLIKGGKDWTDWDTKMATGLEKSQDKDGSWSGQHCITGRTFCTAGALLVLMADRTPFPVDLLKSDNAKPDQPKPATPAKP
jgi:hypothetical protein